VAEVAPVVDRAALAVAAKRRRALLVAGTPGLVFLLLAVIVGGAANALVAGVVAGVVIGAVGSLALWRGGPVVVLRGLGARRVDEDDVPGPATQVEGLCASMGLAIPDLYVVDEAMPNALAVGRGGRGAAVVLTTGLLEVLDPVAMEAVLAHELTHIKRGDVVPATAAAAMALTVGRVLPGTDRLVHRLAGPGREFATDRQSVGVTRYPPGLCQALTAMGADGSPARPAGPLVRRRAAQVTRWLWTAVLPDAQGRLPTGDELVGELDAPGVRVAALQEW
jgi:hypothetical protein